MLIINALSGKTSFQKEVFPDHRTRYDKRPGVFYYFFVTLKHRRTLFII